VLLVVQKLLGMLIEIWKIKHFNNSANIFAYTYSLAR